MNEITVEGVGPLRQALNMVLEDGWDLGVPQPRQRLVEIPGRSGSLDLAGAMGGPFYGDREQSFRFLVRTTDQATARRRITRALHGRRLGYACTMDPGYRYEGRWAVTGFEVLGRTAMIVSVEVVADPYKSLGTMTYRLNALGGRLYRLEGGDMPVRPTIECKTPTTVVFDGRETRVASGTWRLNDVLFEAGWNELYVNSWEVADTDWSYVADLTWDDVEGMTWDELGRLATGAVGEGMTWDGIEYLSWDDAADLTWDDFEEPLPGYEAEPSVDTSVILQYEWKDL